MKTIKVLLTFLGVFFFLIMAVILAMGALAIMPFIVIGVIAWFIAALVKHDLDTKNKNGAD